MLCLILSCFLYIGMGESLLNLGSTTINTTTTYQLEVIDLTFATIDAGSIVKLYLPTAYSASSLSSDSPYSWGNGGGDYCVDDCATVTIGYSGYEITLSNMFPFSASAAFIFTISAVTNPHFAGTTADYKVTIESPVGSVLFDENIVGKQFLPNTINCNGVVTEDNQINTHGSLSITIEPVSNSLANTLSRIRITFPSTWAGQSLNTQTLTPAPYCTSTSQPQIQCTSLGNLIGITNIQFAASIDIEVYSLANPSSVLDAGVISLSTYDQSGKQLDTCSFSATGFQSNELRNVAVTVNYVSDTVLELVLTMKFPSIAMVGDTIVIDIADEIGLSGSSFVVRVGGGVKGAASVTYTVGNNQLQIDTFDTQTDIPEVQIICSNVARPRLALTTGTFQFRTYRSGNLVNDKTCCSLILQPRNSLTLNSLTPSDPYLLSSGVDYIFNITTTQPLISTDTLIIKFSYHYSFSGSVPCSVQSSSITVGTPACTGDSRIITVSNFLTGNEAAGIDLQITISSITNPDANPSLFPFVITILSNTQQIVQRNDMVSLTLSATIIPTYSITASSYQVFNSPTLLTFSFTGTSSIIAGYTIIITIPSALSMQTSALSCEINSVGSECGWDSGEVTIRAGSTIGAVTQFTINGMVNAKSLEPVSGFEFQFVDGDGESVEQSNSTFVQQLTLTQTASFITTILSINAQLYEQQTLSLLLILPYTLTTQYLQISYNTTQMEISSSSCTPISLTCNTPTSSTFTITNLPSNNYINATINQVIVKLPSPTITLTIKSSTHYESVKVTTTIDSVKADIITYSLGQTSWVMGQSADITIDYQIESGNSNISKISVQIPPQYTTAYPNNVYNLTSIIDPFTIPSVTNPSSSSSSPFFLTAYSSDDDVLAISIVNSQFALICQLPCKTCDANTTDCSSCYSSHSLYIYLEGSPGLCVDTCPTGYYLEGSNSSCVECDTNCLSCDENDGTVCESCHASTYLYSGDCYATCPDGLYSSDDSFGVCLDCPSNCLKCTDSLNCSECSGGLLLYGELCLEECPARTYADSGECFDCADSNCVECTSAGCLACMQPFYLHSSQCLAACPLSLYPDLQSSCSACECVSCSFTSYNCTQCGGATPYLYDYSCYTVCPDSTYPDSSNQCVDCTTNCLVCSSDTICTICQQGYLLENSQCVTECSDSTILTISTTNISACENCISPCATCTISTQYCLTCIDGHSLHENTCVSSCPSSLHSIQSVCVSCTDTCLSCESTDPYNCTQCQPNYYLHNRTCFTSCPSGTFTNLGAKQCQACNVICATCLNGTNCTSCVDDYFLFDYQCYTSCPTDPVFYYMYNGHCTACQPQCVDCLDTPVQCTSCISDEYYHNVITHECTFSCSDPYYPNGTTCIPCQSPCLTCDTTYSTCATCSSSRFLHEGKCVSSCPSTHYGSDGKCVGCEHPCVTCTSTRCQTCEPYAFMYKNTCVLECPSDMPFERSGFCSECETVDFCAVCGSNDLGHPICTECVYPYVLFEEECLNQCPTNYTVANNRQCQQSPEYIAYLQQLQQYNKPILYPMFFLSLFCVFAVILAIITNKLYPYTYHIGYLLPLMLIMDSGCLYYCLYFVSTRYLGEVIPVAPQLPLLLLICSLIFNFIILSVVYAAWVLRKVYLADARYQEWKQQRRCYWWWFVLFLMPVFGGHRLHKLNYSKLFGWDSFSFRVVSVAKFFEEDIVTFISFIGDALYLLAMVICAFNLYVTYNAILFLSYEVLIMKVILWVMLFIDLKKPDRGFFKGDEEQAEESIKQQEEEQLNKQQQAKAEKLARLVYTKSTPNIHHQPFFGTIDVDDFISVYDPNDYDEVPKVPKRKIEKNLYKGKFRKGKKITLDEKLKRYIDNIKPYSPPPKRTDSYLKDLLYWKPPPEPTKIIVREKKKSQESMLQLLNQKQIEYKDELDIIDIDESDGVQQKKEEPYYRRPRYNQRNYFQDLDQTIPNETMDYFYPQSIEQQKSSLEYDDLMNLNYARKKHLPKYETKRRDESLRVLHHEPQKKRKNPLSGIGQMIMKKLD